MATDEDDERLNRILNGLVRGHEPLHGFAPAQVRHGVAPMVIDIDPATNRIRRVELQPHDRPADLERVLQFFREQQAPATQAPSAPQPTDAETARGQASTPAQAQGLSGTESVWLGDRIHDYLAHLGRGGNHSATTIKYTYAPSLRQLRELVGDERRQLDGADAWDLTLAGLSPSRIDAYIDAMWRFPAQQGRRTATTDAKAALEAGGEPQSTQNAVKRLSHVLAFVEWLHKRGELHSDVLGRLRAAIDGVSVGKDSGARQALDLAPDDDDAEGYVAFSPDNLRRIFHPDIYVAHSAQDPARFFIPLLARYTGGRVNELAQLTVKDVIELDVEVDGNVCKIPCLSITSHERDENGKVIPIEKRKKRLKTKAGRRILPLHPELIRLGLLRYRNARIKQDKQFLFDLAWYEKHGFGKNPSQDFRALSKAVGVWERRRLVFHSFRATLAQQLEEAGLDAQLVDRVLGHAVKTTRVRHYARNQQGATVPLSRVHQALLKIPVEAQVPPWEFVCDQPRKQLAKLVQALGLGASSSI